MASYTLTAYKKDGSIAAEETFEAKDDREGKAKGEALLEEKKLSETTSRVVSEKGKLVYFHR
ncbi:YhzD family protein [Terrilactibacillus sp. S3-3]|nr:YhzD family protein [Terrilactibacillus sp. S3-3]